LLALCFPTKTSDVSRKTQKNRRFGGKEDFGLEVLEGILQIMFGIWSLAFIFPTETPVSTQFFFKIFTDDCVMVSERVLGFGRNF
jgi:hypothetical protein